MGGGHDSGLTHLDSGGEARMVDVGAKPESERRAVAEARLRMSPETAAAIAAGDGPKGDVLGPARLAGIAAAKRTGELIPLAHPLPLSFADVRGEVDAEAGTVTLTAEARCVGRTGVEMEAMTRRLGRGADRLRHGEGARARDRDRAGGAAAQERRQERRVEPGWLRAPARLADSAPRR